MEYCEASNANGTEESDSGRKMGLRKGSKEPKRVIDRIGNGLKTRMRNRYEPILSNGAIIQYASNTLELNALCADVVILWISNLHVDVDDGILNKHTTPRTHPHSSYGIPMVPIR